MNKFSQEKYTRDAISKLIEELHVTDKYPYEILGDYAGLSASMMRQVADGNRDLKAANFEMLKYNLAERDRNTRAYKIGTPAQYSFVRIGEVESNGCPKDEFIDGSKALHMFLEGYTSTNTDIIDEGITQAEQVLERMKAERARLAGRK